MKEKDNEIKKLFEIGKRISKQLPENKKRSLYFRLLQSIRSENLDKFMEILESHLPQVNPNENDIEVISRILSKGSFLDYAHAILLGILAGFEKGGENGGESNRA